jgi:cytoskeletal protein CcmA (bactofilin family)
MSLYIINPRNQRGIALLSAILLGFIIFGFVTAWLTILYTRNKMAFFEQQRMQAQYIAESGLAKMQWYLSGKGEQKINFAEPQTWEEDLFTKGGKCKFSTAFEYGYLKATCRGTSNKATTEISADIGIEPDSLFPEALVMAEPRGAILGSGASIIGDIRSPSLPTNQGAIWQGKHVSLAAFPILNTSSFEQAVLYFTEMLQNPHKADQELFSAQVFDQESDIPAKGKIYVNDNIVFIGRSEESPLKISGPKIFLSTGDIQISGWANLEGCTIAAMGKVSILDEAKVTGAEIFSMREIIIADNAKVEGKVFSQCDIIITDQAKVSGNSLIYSSGNPSGKVFVGNTAAVSGCVILTGSSGIEGGLFIMDHATIRGLAYSGNRISIQGSIFGVAIGAKLYNPNMDSLSNNYIYGNIKRPDMTADLLLPISFETNPQPGWMKIVK